MLGAVAAGAVRLGRDRLARLRSCFVMNTIGLKSKGLDLVLLSLLYFSFSLAVPRGIAGMRSCPC